MCAIRVREAADGDRPEAGLALVAPGDRHLEVLPDGTLRTNEDPEVNGVRPSVDVTMRAAAAVFGRRAVGVVMTGMGRTAPRGCAPSSRSAAPRWCRTRRRASSGACRAPASTPAAPIAWCRSTRSRTPCARPTALDPRVARHVNSRGTWAASTTSEGSARAAAACRWRCRGRRAPCPTARWSSRRTHRSRCARLGWGQGLITVADVALEPASLRARPRRLAAATPRKQMLRDEAGFVPVCDHGRLLGVVYVEALLQCVADDRTFPNVAKVLSTQIPTCERKSALVDAVRQMIACYLRKIPVVGDAGELLGLLTLSEAAAAARARPGRRRGASSASPARRRCSRAGCADRCLWR